MIRMQVILSFNCCIINNNYNNDNNILLPIWYIKCNSGKYIVIEGVCELNILISAFQMTIIN